MSTFLVQGKKRQPVTLDTVLGRGGEGVVYNLPNMTGAVAKIYRVDRPELLAQIPQRRRKIQAMLTHPPTTMTVEVSGARLPLLAWPTHLIETADSCGFLMTKVRSENSVSLAMYMQDVAIGAVLTPDERCLTSRLYLCRNLAGVLADLHKQGHFVVDFKPPNLRVFRQSCIPCFLDTDSFSIAGKNGRLPATVFSPEYAAPELLEGNSAASGGANDCQDRFALAALLFQILNRGFHPFQGILKHSVDHNETTLDAKIRKRLYPYGLTADPRVDPCEASDYDCLPVPTRELFDRAFQGTPDMRPSAQQWRDHFKACLQAPVPFAPCEKNPTSVMHIHFKGLPCGECRRQAVVVQQPEVTTIFVGGPPTPTWKDRVPWSFIRFVLFLMAIYIAWHYLNQH